jgi:hypothetical protein
LSDPAVAKYILGVLKIREYIDFVVRDIESADEPPIVLRRLTEEDHKALEQRPIEDHKAGNYRPLREMFLYGDRVLSMEARELIVYGNPESRRGVGKPEEPVADREARSIMPPTEDTFYVVYVLLKGLPGPTHRYL